VEYNLVLTVLPLSCFTGLRTLVVTCHSTKTCKVGEWQESSERMVPMPVDKGARRLLELEVGSQVTT